MATRQLLMRGLSSLSPRTPSTHPSRALVSISVLRGHSSTVLGHAAVRQARGSGMWRWWQRNGGASSGHAPRHGVHTHPLLSNSARGKTSITVLPTSRGGDRAMRMSTHDIDPELGSAPSLSVWRHILAPTLLTLGTSVGAYSASTYLHQHRAARSQWQAWCVSTKQTLWHPVWEWAVDNIGPIHPAVMQVLLQDYNYGQRTFIGILLANVAIFALWRIPLYPIRDMTIKYFLHDVHTSSLASMILSAFSHRGVLHLAGNMYLASLCIPQMVQREGRYETMAFYLSAAAASSWFSGIIQVLTRGHPGLGASGAVIAVLAYCSFARSIDQEGSSLALFDKYPLLFSPELHSNDGTFLFIVAVDLIGITLRHLGIYSSGIGHENHLGGAMYAYVYTELLRRDRHGNRAYVKLLQQE